MYNLELKTIKNNNKRIYTEKNILNIWQTKASQS